MAEPHARNRRTDGTPDEADATRRTHLANERTLLAWWRSGLAALAVAVGVGKLLPDIGASPAGPSVALGIAFAVYGVTLIVAGTARHRALGRDLAAGRFSALDDRAVIVLGALGVVLTVASVAMILA